MEEEKSLLSVGDFFKVVFNRKWIVLAVTLVALILGVVFTAFIVNPAQKSYQIYFTMEYPGKSSIYPDGKTFHFQDMVSVEYLEAVKSSNDDFANIDVEKMSEKDGILIYKTSVVEGDEDKADYNLTINDKLYEYRFVVESKYFSSEDQANDFVRTLAAYPAVYTQTSLQTVDFKKNLSTYSSSTVKRYEERLNILNNQYNFLVSKYDELINNFGDSLVVNGKQLSVWLNELNTSYGSYDRERLASNLDKYGYVFNDSVSNDIINDYVYELQSNTKKIEENTEIYTSLITGGTTAETTILTTISSLKTRNVAIEYALSYHSVTVDKSTDIWTWSQDKTSSQYQKYLSDSQAFGEQLDGIKANLEAQADVCKSVMTAAYEQQARVIFSSNNLEVVNKSSVVTNAILAAIIGLIVAALVILAVDMPKYAKKKQSLLNGEVESEKEQSQQLEAAVASSDEQKSE